MNPQPVIMSELLRAMMNGRSSSTVLATEWLSGSIRSKDALESVVDSTKVLMPINAAKRRNMTEYGQKLPKRICHRTLVTNRNAMNSKSAMPRYVPKTIISVSGEQRLTTPSSATAEAGAAPARWVCGEQEP